MIRVRFLKFSRPKMRVLVYANTMLVILYNYYLIQNSRKKSVWPPKNVVKRCEIQSDSQEMAMIVG